MIQTWRNLSLRTRIATLMSLLAVMAVFTLTFLSIQREQANFRQELIDQADLFLETTTLSIRDPLYQLHVDELKELAMAVSDNQHVTLFVVYDAKGRVLVDASQSQITFSQKIDPLGQELVALKGGNIHLDWRQEALIAGRAVVLGNQIIGAVATGLSTSPLDTKIATITQQSIFLALVAVAIGIGLSFLLARQITIQLSELSNLAAQMSEGDFSIRVVPYSSDEVGKLGKAFNQMAESIQERENALRDLAVSLEQTVTERTAELRHQAERLELMAISDPLTKIFNRRHFFTLAEKEMERAARYGHPLAVIMLDTDDFKKINDTYGHPCGDQILVSLVQICQQNIRTVDLFARYGGEEFVLLMPETEAEAALTTAERLRKVVAETPQRYDSIKITLTVSVGVAAWDGKGNSSLSALVSQADQALYQSKQNGRNQVSVWEEM